MAGTIYIEVAKKSGAVLSYSYEKLESKTSDFIEVTQAELNHLNHLEENVFPSGIISTLSDLLDFRVRLKELVQLKAKVARTKLLVAQAQATSLKVRAELNAFMDNAAAERGLSREELEALLEARRKRMAAEIEMSSANRSATGEQFHKIIVEMMKNRHK